ncbi:hypothetical protein [Enterobacter phage Phc]|nr:hypothetical protein [Enterobacter phage Phc]
MNDYQEIIAIMRRLAPPLGQVPDEQLSAWIDLATLFVCGHKFKDKYSYALALYTMHLMFLDGAMKTEDEDVESYTRRVTEFSLNGEFTQRFASISSENQSGKVIRSTPWGKMYEILNKKMGGGFGLITGLKRGCR